MSDNEDMDLFGDVDEELNESPGQSPRRQDSDREDLDSGDDDGRDHRQHAQDLEPEEGYSVEETGIVPHPVPAPSDGEVSTIPPLFMLELALIMPSSTLCASQPSSKSTQNHLMPQLSHHQLSLRASLPLTLPPPLSGTESLRQASWKAMRHSTDGTTA